MQLMLLTSLGVVVRPLFCERYQKMVLKSLFQIKNLWQHLMLLYLSMMVLTNTHGKDQVNCSWRWPGKEKKVGMVCLVYLLLLRMTWIHTRWQYKIH
uniref:Mitochondrial Rho GTPase n=1 Tax=Rhizophora mucronata TaxID=61149 RepID=A0A2P2LK65_RHIMU